MLSIAIPSDGRSGLTFNVLEKYNLPAPPGGFSSEINDSVVTHFDDEQEAIDYAYELDAYALSIDQDSPENDIIADVVKAIRDDKFVRDYLQS